MIRCIDWNGLQAVEFAKGDYTALLVPSVGANLVRLANTRLGVEILRTPAADEIGTFKGRPQIFGLPVLFPPNRIAGGRYTFEGRTYQYPITIEKEHNYHHGILKSQPFAVSKALENDDEVLIECRYYANAGNDAIYRDFPHAFKCKITFRLSNEGLAQEIMFANRSAERMPVGVGFHTPMRIKEVAAECGFYDPADFCRMFRKKFGRTPTRYRKSPGQEFPSASGEDSGRSIADFLSQSDPPTPSRLPKTHAPSDSARKVPSSRFSAN